MARPEYIYDHGSLDRRITIQNYTSKIDALGQKVLTFETFKEVWAKVEEKSGREGETADQLIATKRVEFVIRYRTDVDETMRIVYRGETYRIESIIADDARKAFLRLVTRWAD